MATRTVADGAYRAAASKVVMRSGRHFARFTVIQDYRMLLGVIRPGPVEGGANTEDVDGHCFYRAATGSRFPGTIGWEGSSPRNSRATASACCSTSTRAA